MERPSQRDLDRCRDSGRPRFGGASRCGGQSNQGSCRKTILADQPSEANLVTQSRESGLIVQCRRPVAWRRFRALETGVKATVAQQVSIRRGEVPLNAVVDQVDTCNREEPRL